MIQNETVRSKLKIKPKDGCLKVTKQVLRIRIP